MPFRLASDYWFRGAGVPPCEVTLSMHAHETQSSPVKRSRPKKRNPDRRTLAGEVLYLQQTAGNEAVTSLLTSLQRTPDRASVQRDGAPEQFPLEETLMRVVQRRRATGLAKGGEVKAYVAATKKAQGTWATLKTPADRANMLGKLANDRLAAAGVLQVAIRIDPSLSAQTNGQFDFTTWSIALNGALVNRSSVTDAQLKSVAGTIYHEARHAEQWYRIAQWLAGQGKKASAIATEMQIAPAAAKAAVAAPLAEPGWWFRLRHSPEELADNQQKLDEAKAWYDNIYGTGGDARNAVLNALDPDAAAYKAAVTAYNKAAAATASASKRYQAARRVLKQKEGALAKVAKAVKAQVQTTSHGDLEEVKALTSEVRAQRVVVARLNNAWVKAQQAEAAAGKTLAAATTKTQTGYQAYRNLVEEADAWALTAEVESGF